MVGTFGRSLGFLGVEFVGIGNARTQTTVISIVGTITTFFRNAFKTRVVENTARMGQGFRLRKKLSKSSSRVVVSDDLVDFGKEVGSSSLAGTDEQIFKSFGAGHGASRHRPGDGVEWVEKF